MKDNTKYLISNYQLGVIIFGGTSKQIEKQKICLHEWQGVCIDEISRYYKCTKYYCLMRDCTEIEYYKIIDIKGEFED